MKKIVIFFRNLLILLMLLYFSYHLFWEIHGIEIVRLEKDCKEYISPNNKEALVKDDSYIVYGYHHSKKNEKILDEFACEQADSLLIKYDIVFVTFDRFSYYTNNMPYRKNSFLTEAYTLTYDYLWDYSFSKNNKSVGKTKVKNWENLKFYYPKPECRVNKYHN